MFTAQQAADPGTPAQMLADIAALRPDLRPLVAANPSAYPGLLEWLGSLGEPAVDAALAARTAAQPSAPVAPPAPAGWAPAAAPAVPHQPAQPWEGQPAQPWQGQPAQPYVGQPGQPYPGQPAQPYGAQPGQPYPGQPYQPAGTPPSGSGKKVLIVVGIVLGVLLLLGVGAIFAARALFSNAIDSLNSFAPTSFTSGEKYGDDPAMDALWDACAGGDWASCDNLYISAEFGSEYEDFGGSCGGTETGADGTCAAIHGVESTPAAGEPNGYGDDPGLDALYDACTGGDMASCDSLYDESPFGSDYETYGDTCGETREAGTGLYCVEG